MQSDKKNQKTLSAKAYAKINLTLDVTGVRPDGYHSVEMVMQTVSLHDNVTVSIAEKTESGEISLSCNWAFLPLDNNNLAYKAAALFYKKTGILQRNTDIFIEKHIPVAAGLAGGSTDAAAVLKLLNELYQTNLSVQALCDMGVELGADIPYCIRGGTMLARGIGEELSPLPAIPNCHVVLCKPPVSISTKEIYEQIDNAKIPKKPNTAAMIAALEQSDFNAICANLCNVMEEVTIRKQGEIIQIKEILKENGANGVLMSGSGPTVYGLFSEENCAKSAANLLTRRFADTFLAKTI